MIVDRVRGGGGTLKLAVCDGEGCYPREQPVSEVKTQGHFITRSDEEIDKFLDAIGWKVDGTGPGRKTICPFCSGDPEGLEKLRKVFERKQDN